MTYARSAAEAGVFPGQQSCQFLCRAPPWAREGCWCGRRWPGWWQGPPGAAPWAVAVCTHVCSLSFHRQSLPCCKQDFPSGLECERGLSWFNCCCFFIPCRLLCCSWTPKVPLIASPLSKTVPRCLPSAPWPALSRWEHISAGKSWHISLSSTCKTISWATLGKLTCRSPCSSGLKPHALCVFST